MSQRVVKIAIVEEIFIVSSYAKIALYNSIWAPVDIREHCVQATICYARSLPFRVPSFPSQSLVY